jgi:WD40 repeat protein
MGVSKTIQCWDVAGRHLACTLELPADVAHMVVSPDGRFLAVSGTQGTVLLDWTSGEQRFSLDGQCDLLAFSPDSRWLATSRGGGVRITDVATGQTVRTLAATLPGSAAYRLAFSQDGRRVLLCEQGERITVWNAHTGQRLLSHEALKGEQFRGPGVWALAFSPDGRRLASIEHEEVDLWDVDSGQQVFTLRGITRDEKDFLFSLAWSADGNQLAAGTMMGRVRIWDAAPPTER